MSWRGRLPQLEARLREHGADGAFEVVEELPRNGYLALMTVPTVVVGGFIVDAQRNLESVVGVALAVAVVALLTQHWTSSAVVLAGSTWVARHTAFRWHLVQLDRLRKVDHYVSTGQGVWVWLRLWDTEGGRVALDAWSVVPRIRGLLVPYVAQAMAAGVPVERRAAEIVGVL